MTARAWLLIIVVLAVCVAMLFGATQRISDDAMRGITRARDSLTAVVAVLDHRADSLQRAYRRDTLWRTRTRTVVESLSVAVDALAATDTTSVPMLVPLSAVVTIVAAARAADSACTATVRTCEERVAVADSARAVAVATTALADSGTRLMTRERDHARKQAIVARIGAVVVVVVAFWRR